MLNKKSQLLYEMHNKKCKDAWSEIADGSETFNVLVKL